MVSEEDQADIGLARRAESPRSQHIKQGWSLNPCWGRGNPPRHSFCSHSLVGGVHGDGQEGGGAPLRQRGR